MNTQLTKLVLQNDELEKHIITYWSLQSYAHYLYGLGLRQEILSAFLEI